MDLRTKANGLAGSWVNGDHSFVLVEILETAESKLEAMSLTIHVYHALQRWDDGETQYAFDFQDAIHRKAGE